MTSKFFVVGALLAALIMSPLVGVVAASAATVLYTAKVPAGDVLNVRSGPGTGYKVISQVGAGTVSVYAEKSGWAQIATTQKWVSTQYLVKTTKTTAKAATTPTVQISSAPVMPKVTTKAVSGAVASVATTAVTNFTAACKAAMKAADTYCQKHALSGCASGVAGTPSARCQAADADCAAHQEAALAQCPSL